MTNEDQSMAAQDLQFTSDTEIGIVGSTKIKGVHLKDLSFVVDVDHDDGVINRCDIDIHELIRVATLYGSMEEQRYSWRR